MGNFEILCGFGIFSFLLYCYLTATFNFWKKRGIPGPKPVLLMFNVMKDFIFKNLFVGKFLKDIYDAYENTPFIGFFYLQEPILMIKDPKFIKDVLIKDSSIFYNRDLNSCPKAESSHHFLFYASGLKAQLLKTKLSLAFTPNKYKIMFCSILESLERFDDYLEELLSKDDCVNCNNLINKLTADMFGRGFIGIDLNTLTKETNKGNTFLKYTKDAMRTSWKSLIKTLLTNTVPQVYNLFGYYMFDNAKMTEFFTDLAINIMEQRKKHATSKHDVVRLLMEIKENPGKLAEITDITDEFLAAQLIGLFVAGYETSSTTILNTLYELALNQNIQDKLREEIQNNYNKNQKPECEDINNLSYLDAVFKETLRKYPVINIGRKSLSSYTFKDTKLTIPKDQNIIIPVYAIHHDPKIYPNPEVYDPERFTKEAIQSRDPMHYISFGYGSRYCIGERIGILQTKLALISILQKYKIDVCQKTITSYIFPTSPFISISINPIILKITKIY
ncbi:cytochrome P450 6A1-like [Cataglyphis hispanica]|uniref:cytochrome P450 6A1-like n=1 Tax=Cataglyphis hispanica TaxID=1086592 RepID=UPI00217FB8D4|nr:cytochrome P450 6A1-like [Cataglyphis hispanica]XP_050451967.1 cytochrome P450 6A1-like [Cataglyphis hispanica]XP_050451968.1 cytochrome P450 6A1-like [Cataglyphis hispanica]